MDKTVVFVLFPPEHESEARKDIAKLSRMWKHRPLHLNLLTKDMSDFFDFTLKDAVSNRREGTLKLFAKFFSYPAVMRLTILTHELLHHDTYCSADMQPFYAFIDSEYPILDDELSRVRHEFLFTEPDEYYVWSKMKSAYPYLWPYDRQYYSRVAQTQSEINDFDKAMEQLVRLALLHQINKGTEDEKLYVSLTDNGLRMIAKREGYAISTAVRKFVELYVNYVAAFKLDSKVCKEIYSTYVLIESKVASMQKHGIPNRASAG